jgi:hypothetical protein
MNIFISVLDGIQYLPGQYNPSSHVDMLNVLVSTCFSSSHDFSFRICQFPVFSNSQYLLLVLIGSSHFSVSLSISVISTHWFILFFSITQYMSVFSVQYVSVYVISTH